MTRPDRFTLTPADTARRAHAKEPEDDGPDFQPGDLPESTPVIIPPGEAINDPWDTRKVAAPWERPLRNDRSAA